MTLPVIKDHCSILHSNRPIKLVHCSKKSCGCGHVHCPFCDVDQFKPTTQSRVRDHLESTHFAHAVVSQGLQYVKCYHDCKEGSGKPGHYHCAYCSKTILKKNAFVTHLKNHLKNHLNKSSSEDKNLDEQDVSLFAPDSRLPYKISLSQKGKGSTEVNLCTQTCDGGESNKHYHCPQCEKVTLDRSQLIMHWWRCQPAVPGRREEEEFTHPRSIQHPRDVEGIQWHTSIVRSLSDLHTEKCTKSDCCQGLYYHCDLCPIILTQSFSRVKAHYKKHWHKKVKFKDYSILPCYLSCENTVQARCHYHCPVCGETRRRRLAFEHHLSICRGDKHKTHSFAIKRSKELKEVENFQEFMGCDTNAKNNGLENTNEESAASDIKQEEKVEVYAEGVDSEDVDDILDTREDNTVNDLDDRDTNEDNDTELQELQAEDVKVTLDLKALQVFEETTAKISQKLVQALGSEEMRNLLTEICGESLSFDTAPGIFTEVFTLSGQMEELMTARNYINKFVEEKFVSDETTNEITDKGEDTVEEDPMLQCEKISPVVDNLPKTESTLKRMETGSKNRSRTKKNDKENIEEIPGKRYSTRGVKLDFEALAHGRKMESMANGKDQRGTSPKQRSENIDYDEENSSDNRSKVDESVEASLETKELEDTVDDKDKIEQDILDISWSTESDVDNSKEIGESVEKSDPLLSRKEETNSDMVQHATAFIPEIILAPKKCRRTRGKALENDSDDTDDDLDETDDDLGGLEKEKIKEDNTENKDFTDGSNSIPRKRKFRSGKIFSVDENESDQDSSRIKRRKSKMAECRHCDFVSESFSDVTSHIIQNHPDVTEARCDLCKRAFDKKTYLELHLQQKHGPLQENECTTFSCLACQKSFRSEQALSNHTEKSHSGNTDTATPSWKSEFHMCEMCGKKFRTRSHLLVHKQSVHQKQNLTCDICQKTFSHVRYLQTHRKRHFAEKKYFCKLCGASYRDKNTLILHMNIHNPEDKREYKFVCSYCGKKFMSRCVFNEHLNKHTGDKPFQCLECMKSFAHRSTLEKHKIFVHSTERPFKCSQCDKAFKLERLLKQHLIVHTKDSDYVCERCNKTYTCKHSLRQHRKRCKGAPEHVDTTDILVVTRNSKYTKPARKATSLLKNLPGYTTVSLHQVNSDNIQPSVIESNFNAVLADSTNVISQPIPRYDQDVQNVMKPQKEGELGQVSYIQSEENQNEIVQNILQLTSNEAANHLQASSHMTQVIMEAESQPDFTKEVEAGDVNNDEVYMCSECNTSFLDYATAEHHVLSAHTTVDEHDGIVLQLEQGSV